VCKVAVEGHQGPEEKAMTYEEILKRFDNVEV
jgi:hypothetical protein